MMVVADDGGGDDDVAGSVLHMWYVVVGKV